MYENSMLTHIYWFKCNETSHILFLHQKQKHLWSSLLRVLMFCNFNFISSPLRKDGDDATNARAYFSEQAVPLEASFQRKLAGRKALSSDKIQNTQWCTQWCKGVCTRDQHSKNTLEAERERSGMWGHPRLHSKTLSQNTPPQKKLPMAPMARWWCV